MRKPAARPAQTPPVEAPPKTWVIDASVTLPWFFADEATPFTERLLDAVGEREMWAPPLWVIECTNVLQSAQRRRRIDAAQRAEIVGELSALPVRVDLGLPDWGRLDRLAAAHGLSAYDATYLDLALRRSAVLVTQDRDLIAAARSLGHPVLASLSDLAG